MDEQELFILSFFESCFRDALEISTDSTGSQHTIILGTEGASGIQYPISISWT